MKKFFSSMEERFVFPIGRKTWQILSLLALLLFVFAILYFVYNLFPAGMEDVKIAKEEVLGQQKVETQETQPVKEIALCTKEDYNKWQDSLKRQLPGLEWKNLGDSVDVTEWMQSEDGEWYQGTKKYFQQNPEAAPNKIKRIYESRYSPGLCDSIDVLRALHTLLKETDKNYREKAFEVFINAMVYNRELDLRKSLLAVSIKRDILMDNLLVNDEAGYKKFANVISAALSYNPSEVKMTETKNLITAHNQLPKRIFAKAKYLDLVRVIFDTGLDNSELTNAMETFITDVQYYDKEDMPRVLRRYFNLYTDKLGAAKMKQEAESIKKAENRAMAIDYGTKAFIAIVGIATILLLFSIQSMLRKHIKPE